jgi:hypothetical protein
LLGWQLLRFGRPSRCDVVRDRHVLQRRIERVHGLHHWQLRCGDRRGSLQRLSSW